MAGHRGDTTAARAGLGAGHGAVRATALGALARSGALTADDIRAGAADADAAVRVRSAELAHLTGPGPAGVLVGLLGDPEADVVEAACFGLGEMGDALAGDADVAAALSGVAGNHPDPLCREAAVAAIGAIGAPGGRAAVLAAMGDKPAVRRRAVLALSAFEGADVEAALAAALEDRDWQVRQAAEDLTGHRPAG